MKLLLNQTTKNRIDKFIIKPSHVLIIEAPEGSGKLTLAKELANQLLNSTSKSGVEKIRHISPVDGVISIEAVRELKEFLRLKSLAKSSLERVILIENADAMTIEAQNSLLKTLEEPPADTVLLLTSSKPADLLPTIKSRAQILSLQRLPKKDLLDYFRRLGHQPSEIERAFHIAHGRIGLMHSLLSGSQDSLLNNIDKAKQILSQQPFDRLNLVDVFSKDKNNTRSLLDALDVVCLAGMKAAGTADKLEQVKRWHKNLEAITQAKLDLAKQANLKLLLTNLLINL